MIAATGYKVDMERLSFLNPAIRAKLKCVNGTPVLSSSFESSVPGLYFVGIAAANSFGPVMRFAFGAGFAAKRLTSTVAKSLERSTAPFGRPALRRSRNERPSEARLTLLLPLSTSGRSTPRVFQFMFPMPRLRFS